VDCNFAMSNWTNAGLHFCPTSIEIDSAVFCAVFSLHIRGPSRFRNVGLTVAKRICIPADISKNGLVRAETQSQLRIKKKIFSPFIISHIVRGKSDGKTRTMAVVAMSNQRTRYIHLQGHCRSHRRHHNPNDRRG
jgi:hypothetical protein